MIEVEDGLAQHVLGQKTETGNYFGVHVAEGARGRVAHSEFLGGTILVRH